MRNGIAACLIAGCLLALAGGNSVAAGQVLTVGVCNMAHVRDEIFELALAEAQRLFSEVGVATEWVDRYASPGTPVAVNLRILPGGSRNESHPDAFGNAFLTRPLKESNLADVYYGQVLDRAWPNPQVAMLLAHVMAHEVGHLLLGPKHSDTGLISGNWSEAECTMAQYQRLSFSAAAATPLRAAVAARVGVLPAENR